MFYGDFMVSKERERERGVRLTLEMSSEVHPTIVLGVAHLSYHYRRDSVHMAAVHTYNIVIITQEQDLTTTALILYR